MEITGTVISIDENIATIAVKRTSACGDNCANCKGGCTPTTIKSTAENVIGAKVGDIVKVESNSTDVVRAAFILYIAPILITIIAAVTTYAMEIANIFVILISVFSFFASFLVVKFFEKRLVPKSYITKILGKDVN